MKNKILKIVRKNAWILIIFLVIICINFYLISFLEKAQVSKHKLANKTLEGLCPIEYGKPDCINSKLVISFYNPNDFDLENVRITANTTEGSDIYNVNESLVPNKLETLQLIQCYDINNVVISWCCYDTCYEAGLKNYSEDIKLVKQ